MTNRPPRQRLLGTWKSDRLRTFRHWKPSARAAHAQTRKFRGLFGRLVVRWTAKRVYITLDDFTDCQPYEVVAEDMNSVVLRVPCSESLGGAELVQIHLDSDGERYWMAINWSQGFVEWFRKESKTGTRT